jgi:hypothetical protein
MCGSGEGRGLFDYKTATARAEMPRSRGDAASHLGHAGDKGRRLIRGADFMRGLFLAAGLLLAACVPAGPAPQTPPPATAEQICVDAFLVEGSALRRELESSADIECNHDEMTRTLRVVTGDFRASTITARAKSTLGVMAARFAVPVADPAENVTRLLAGVAFPEVESARIIVPTRRTTVAGRTISNSAVVFASPRRGVALVCALGNVEGATTVVAMVCRGTSELAERRLRAMAERIVAEDFTGIRW